MSDLTGRRRPRADAERNRAAVLDAAIRELGRRPGASTEEIAAAAGVARQTVYAHYPSREALLGAVVERITAEVLRVLDAVDVTGPAEAALGRWLDACWSLLARYPMLLNGAIPAAADEHDRHLPISARLTPVISRGRRSGEFTRSMSVEWLIAAIIGLGHAAGREAAAGRMTLDAAGRAFRESALRVCRDGAGARPGM